MNASHNFAALEALNSKEINLNEYTFAQERFDERFGLVYYMKSKGSTKSLLVKERSRALTAEQFDEIYYRLQIVNDYLLKIYGVKQVVGSSTFQIYFEEFSTDLQAEIKRHLTEKTRFSEGELYAILYSAINALACLEQNQVSHDFLVPMNILKLSKDIYKLHDNYTLATKQHLYNHALRGQHKRYLAPELLDSLTHKREQPDEHDPHKADIYALGMCILDAGLLETEGDYIHKRLNILDEKGLNQALKRFEDLYSPAMRQILQDMLLQDPSYRPSASLLQRRLPGKPRLPGQPSSSAKKRKALDQLINSPDKNRSRNDPFLVRSPSRVHEDPFSPGYPSTDQRLLVVERSPPFEPNRLPQDFFSQPQPFGAYPEVVHNFEPSLSNVSPSIRSDPVLSKFINRGPEPIQQTIPQQFVQSPTPPVQGYPWHQPLSAQPNYSQQIGFPIHQDLYHDPYRTNLSYSSAPVQDVSTYRSSQSDYLQHSIHPQQVIRTSIPPSYQPHVAPSYGTFPGSYLAGGPTLGGPAFGGSMVGNPYEPRSPTKIDEMINRALERSSANLRSAQPGLDPIVERQVSEDYSSTPAGSKVLDPRASQNPNFQQGKK